jgi:anti-sigma B factor antagonist
VPQEIQEQALTGFAWPTAASVLEVEGSLREPLDSDLRDNVAVMLKRGHRRIVLDLARVSDVDAAGVGELVRAFNLVYAAGGELRIANASERVNHFLRVTGLLALII